MRVLLFTAILILALGIPGVNVYHHMTLPKFDNYRITQQHYFSNKARYFLAKHIDIRLETEIKDAEFYKDVMATLQSADKGDVITFHLAGYGGNGDTMMALISNIQQTKAYVIMSVEAPVYSAHAYLAIYGNELRMAPFSFLMFHRSTIANLDCSQQKGLDRGVPNVIHCDAYKAAQVAAETRLIDSSKILTDGDKAFIKAGFDVYIQPMDLLIRTTPEPNKVSQVKL